MASGTYDTPTGRASFLDDVLVEEWDDESRIYTDHTTDPPTTRPYTEAENDAADDAVVGSLRLDSLESRIEALERFIYGTPPDTPTSPDDPDVKEWSDYAGAWPDGHLLMENGVIYRNVSGVPLSSPPSAFPGDPAQWGHIFKVELGAPVPDPEIPTETPPLWSADARYEVGDIVSLDGKTWECLVAHGSEYQGTWRPGTAHTVWKELGSVA